MCPLLIYIAEAHARDQWPVGETISCVNQPTTLNERINNARDLQRKFDCEVPMLVDNMDNIFHTTYGAWPFRFYLIHEGKLVFKAEPHKETFTYNMDELDRWITNFHQLRTSAI